MKLPNSLAKKYCAPYPVFKASTLAAALTTMTLTMVSSEAAIRYDLRGNPNYDTLGDLSIYQPPIGEIKPTVMLMLDKSGSMGNFTQNSTRIDSLWDDYGSLDYQKSSYTVTDYIERVEREYICTRYWFWGSCREGYWKETIVTDTVKTTYDYHTPSLIGKDNKPCYYSNSSKTTVQNALDRGAYPSGFNENFFRQTRQDDGQSYEITYCIDTTAQDTRTAEEIEAGDIPTNWRLDRLSALKVAAFKLLRNPKMDQNISVGAGSFGYNKNISDVGSRFGKIGVAAKPLNTLQKNDLRKYIANLEPRGGTPTAMAYTEAGAYVLGTSTSNAGNEYSGILNSTRDNIIFNQSGYIKPESSQCAGTGIYLLTDGLPNNSNSTSTEKAMKQSLDSSNNFSCGSSMTNSGSNTTAGWNCIGDYAKALNNKGIKTAMVGFGGDFRAFEDARSFQSIQSTLSDGTPYEKKYYRCDLLTNKDAQNSCNLGMESKDDKTGFTGFNNVGGFGEGGFYYAKDAKDIVNSVLSFVTKLDNDLASIPSGTITIPQDPLSAQNIQPYAYLPMLEPKVGSSLLVWPGNLKKYEVNQGTLFGKSATGDDADTRLYVNIDRDGNIDKTGKKFPSELNPNARDLWSSRNQQAVDKNGRTVNANDRITAGGFYAKLKSPKAPENSSRAVYVESNSGLKKLAVVGGELQGFVDLDNDYGALEKLYLLSFLGYDITINDDLVKKINLASNQEAELKKLITSPSGEVKVLGGVLHSQPTLVSYGGKINSPNKSTNNQIDADAGQISMLDKDRTDYVMFGSMEGALHLANSETGEEALAFIPKALIKQQLRALKKDAVNIIDSNNTLTYPPVFGVDAPWVASGSYSYQFNEDGSGKVTANNMKIYGGLGKGESGLYGLNVSKISDPKKLFTINPQTSGYSEIGKIMAKPIFGKVKIGSDLNAIKDVIIFGGGYDMCYEDPTFKLNSSSNQISNCNKSQAKGNAVYIADANSGNLLVSISGANSGSKNINVPSMKHSVVSEITTLDRDNDGLIDHLYFGDLGGQVYRVDLQNGQNVSSTAEINTFVRRVTRVLNTSGDSSSDNISKGLLNKGLQYRFYAQPSVSFFQPDGVGSKRIAVVNIASGDRSSPLSRERKELSEANRVFGIIDKDIVDPNLYGLNMKAQVENLTLDKLALLPFDKVATPSGKPNVPKTKAGVIAAMKSGTFQGWSYPLTYFDGYSNIKNVKSMGAGLVQGGIYYLTAYSPEMQYDATINACSAQVVGGSERQLYCLPWGICESDDAINGMGGYVRAGRGIQELALGAFSKDYTNVQVLIGNQSLSEQVDTSNRSGYGSRNSGSSGPNVVPHTVLGSSNPNTLGGMGSAGVFGNMSGYTLYPQRWYQKSAE